MLSQTIATTYNQAINYCTPTLGYAVFLLLIERNIKQLSEKGILGDHNKSVYLPFDRTNKPFFALHLSDLLGRTFQKVGLYDAIHLPSIPWTTGGVLQSGLGALSPQIYSMNAFQDPALLPLLATNFVKKGDVAEHHV